MAVKATITARDLKKHRVALQTSGWLSNLFHRMRRDKAAKVTPHKVIRALNAAEVSFVLMGTHGVVGWRSESRSTHDVDVLIEARHHRKAIKAIRQAFPMFPVEDNPVVTRFTDPAINEVVIDLMKPCADILLAAFEFNVPIGRTHRIPDLEMALASKFAAMVSPNRRPDKKLIDAGDFVNIVITNRKDIDLNKLAGLANRVYSDGGAEILQLIKDIDAGRQIKL
jgi:hypothetical protein